MSAPRMVTVDQVARLLGVSRRKVIELISDGTLRWSLADDKKTVIIELPPDRDHPPSPPQGDAGAPAKRASFGGDRWTVSETEAWSQRK